MRKRGGTLPSCNEIVLLTQARLNTTSTGPMLQTMARELAPLHQGESSKAATREAYGKTLLELGAEMPWAVIKLLWPASPRRVRSGVPSCFHLVFYLFGFV